MDTYVNGYDSGIFADYSGWGAVGSFLIGIALIILLIALVIWILTVIGKWKLLTKAGEKGWKAIIPIYDTYTLCQITGVNPLWVLIVICGSMVGAIFPILNIVAYALSIYFMILLSVSVAKSFGKESGYAAGLIFLAPIFYLMLGCGKSTYVGKKPMNDVILNLFNQNKTNPNPENPSAQNVPNATIVTEEANPNATVNFCPDCGTKLSETDRFCPNCGKAR